MSILYIGRKKKVNVPEGAIYFPPDQKDKFLLALLYTGQKISHVDMDKVICPFQGVNLLSVSTIFDQITVYDVSVPDSWSLVPYTIGL